MFVKHIEEQDFIDAGFTLNSLTRETFSKQTIDSNTISTYVQVWLQINTFRFKAVTDKEGSVEYGFIRNKQDLAEVNRRFFEDHKREFLIRQLVPLVDERVEMDNIQRALLLNMIESANEEEIDELIKAHFGDSNEKA